MIADKFFASAGDFGPETKPLLENETLEEDKFQKRTIYYFKPDQFITRAEIAKIAVKTADLKSLVEEKRNIVQKIILFAQKIF